MKIKLWLIPICGLVMSANVIADQEVRTPIKCHLQIEDTTTVIRQFVVNNVDTKEFIENVVEKTVYMPDGRTKQQIINVYECVGLKSSFKSSAAIELEKSTPF